MLCFELEVLISESAYVVAYEVIIIFFLNPVATAKSFCIVASCRVHFAFFCIFRPSSLVGGYTSLSSLISHTAVAAVSGLLECFAVATGK